MSDSIFWDCGQATTLNLFFSLFSTLLLSLDPYVKVWLQFGDKRIEKRKTPIFKCTLNPVFNEAFSFNVPWEKIRECSLDVMVMDFDNIGRNELIGRIQLAGTVFFDNSLNASATMSLSLSLLPSQSYHYQRCRFLYASMRAYNYRITLLFVGKISGKNGSGASETKHWQDMITKPRQTIVQWHRLKPE